MKRHRPSGAEVRKLKKKREEEAKSLSGSLFKFVQPKQNAANPSTSTSTSIHEECPTNDDVVCKSNLENVTADIFELPEQGEEEEKESKEERKKEDILGENLAEKDLEEVSQKEEKKYEGDRPDFYLDVSDWPLPLPDDLRIELLKRGSDDFQNKDGPFTGVQRSGQKTNGETRQMSRSWFYKNLPNGETILRKWMVYSPKKHMLYCFCCRLFYVNFKDSGATKFVSGFDKWWKLNPKVSLHESSEQHLSCLKN